MSKYDPRIIAIALEDLLQEITKWSSKASGTLAAASDTQRQIRETVGREIHRVAILMNQAQQDKTTAVEIRAEVAAMLDKNAVALNESKDTLTYARKMQQAASSTLRFWDDELRKALAWLARAEARLERALSELARAQYEYEQARRERDYAQSQYNACRNDAQRSNCNREARDLDNAQIRLKKAADWVYAAETEVAAARAEVAAARARVNCCQRAVGYATEAVDVAQQAESEAQQALSSAERSYEFAQAAEKSAFVAQEKADVEIQLVEQMMSLTKTALLLTEEAANELTTADKMEESAQNYARGAIREIEYRRQLLYHINRRDLNLSSSNIAS